MDLVEAGGVEPTKLIENTQLTDFRFPLILPIQGIPSTLARFGTVPSRPPAFSPAPKMASEIGATQTSLLLVQLHSTGEPKEEAWRSARPKGLPILK